MGSNDSTQLQPKISNKQLDEVNNYIAIELSYSLCVLLPHAEGTKLLEVLHKCEFIQSSILSCTQNDIIEFDKTAHSINTAAITQRQYRNSKMHFLLGLDEEKANDESN